MKPKKLRLILAKMDKIAPKAGRPKHMKKSKMLKKPSEIERIKLKANYFNGLSIGLMIGGLLIPYLVVTQNLGTIIEKLTSSSPWTFAEIANPIAKIIAFAMAFTGARKLRRIANDILSQLDK